MASMNNNNIRLCAYCLHQITDLPKFFEFYDCSRAEHSAHALFDLALSETNLDRSPEEYVHMISYHDICFVKFHYVCNKYEEVRELLHADLSAPTLRPFKFWEIRRALNDFDQKNSLWLSDIGLDTIIANLATSSSNATQNLDDLNLPSQRLAVNTTTAEAINSVESLMNMIYRMPGRLLKLIDLIDAAADSINKAVKLAYKEGALSVNADAKPSKGPHLYDPNRATSQSIQQGDRSAAAQQILPNILRVYRELFRHLFAMQDLDRSPEVFTNFFGLSPSYKRPSDLHSKQVLNRFSNPNLKVSMRRILNICELDSYANAVFNRLQSFEKEVLPNLAIIISVLEELNPEFCFYFGYSLFEHFVDVLQNRVDQPNTTRETSVTDTILEDMNNSHDVFGSACDDFIAKLRSSADLAWQHLRPGVVMLFDRLAYITISSELGQPTQKRLTVSTTKGFARLMLYLASGQDYERLIAGMENNTTKLMQTVPSLFYLQPGSSAYQAIINGKSPAPAQTMKLD